MAAMQSSWWTFVLAALSAGCLQQPSETGGHPAFEGEPGQGGAAIAAGPFDRNFDWKGGKRALTYCVDGAMLAPLAAAARAAATDLSNAGFGWTFVEVGNACPANWAMRPAAGAMQPDLRFRSMAMGPVQVPPGGRYPTDWEEDHYKATPDMPAGGPGGWAFPPLAYFQPGPIVAPKEFGAAEIVFNENVAWSSVPGAAAFDPRNTAMHELGHAIRLDHDEPGAGFFDDDVSVTVVGAVAGAGVVIVQQGADGILQTVPPQGDDTVVLGDLTAGPDGIADSGKETNLMERFAVWSQHGANPHVGLPAGRWSYTRREKASALASAANRPAGAGGGGGNNPGGNNGGNGGGGNWGNGGNGGNPGDDGFGDGGGDGQEPLPDTGCACDVTWGCDQCDCEPIEECQPADPYGDDPYAEEPAECECDLYWGYCDYCWCEPYEDCAGEYPEE